MSGGGNRDLTRGGGWGREGEGRKQGGEEEEEEKNDEQKENLVVVIPDDCGKLPDDKVCGHFQ